MNNVQRSSKEVFKQSCDTDNLVDNWILNADAQRRFHYRPDEHSIDHLIELMVTNSFLFGEFEEVEENEKPEA